MPERITITVRPSGAHPDVLTIEDAMRQVLDVFEMLEPAPGVEWKLISATTNSPLRIQAEAVSFEPSVDVTVVARAQKQKLARHLRVIASGELPDDPEFKAAPVKRVMARNQNGVGTTDIDLEIVPPFVITPKIAQAASELLERKKPSELYSGIGVRDEIGTIEGTLSDVGTHYNVPAAKIIDSRGREVWCRLTQDLQETLQDKAKYKDVWQHRRVFVRGRIKYGKEGEILYIVATDIRQIEGRDVSLEQIKDPNFTSGLPVGEYLNRFRDGALGG